MSREERTTDMALDSTTESISHFIGLFELAIEELRFRDQYDTFKAERAVEQKAELEDAPRVILKAPYELKAGKDVEPAEFADVAEGARALSVIVDAPPAPTPVASAAPEAVPDEDFYFDSPTDPNYFIVAMEAEVSQAEPEIELPVPGSIATLTKQTVILSDNDIFGGSEGFVPPETLLDALADATEIANVLNLAWNDWLDLSSTPTVEDALELSAQVAEAEVPENDGSATVFLATGEDASGIVVNGQLVEEMPEIEDVLPAFLAPDPTNEETAESTPNPGPVFSKAEAETTAPAEEEPMTPQVVTGANLLVNEVVISTNWLDAPVIAVSGDVVNMATVSQVNVMYDLDDAPGDGTDSPSAAINAAALSAVSFVPGSDTGGEPEGLPQFWHIERLEGDVTALNIFQQYIFATDTDRVELSYSGSSTYLGTGENMMANSALSAQLGFAYDLIIIGGSMVTVNSITQTNVLLDNDTVTAAAGMPASVSTNDNLVMNQAVLETQGIDTYMELADNFADAVRDMAEGATELAQNVAEDDLFEGSEVLRALYISGDLITMNIVEQTNILGDQDQVNLAMEDVLDGAAGPLSVTTGSNALVNSATVISQGMDSVVMAGGDIYDDALLYQAEFVDLDGAPEGVSMTALANEAVAFLADDMVLPEVPDPETAVAQIFDESPSVDVMQTVLS